MGYDKTTVAPRLTQPLKSQSNGQDGVAAEFAEQAKRLGLDEAKNINSDAVSTAAIEARFITVQDPVIETKTGRLPSVPVHEALKLNELKDRVEGRDPAEREPAQAGIREAKDGTIHGLLPNEPRRDAESEDTTNAPLHENIPPTRTNPLFPPLPLYGPPSLLRSVQCLWFRCCSAVLSLCFLMTIVLGAIITNIPKMCRHLILRALRKDPDAKRPFYEEEQRRKRNRDEIEAEWQARRKIKRRRSASGSTEESHDIEEQQYIPTEGGPDPLVCDIGYYARRVGLDVEEYDVQTEDGYIIQLYHIYNPKEHQSQTPYLRRHKSAEVFREESNLDPLTSAQSRQRSGKPGYPVLLIHGLLQSAGAYCCNDENSLAFFLAKSGFDVWLGNNRCGFNPRHCLLKYNDPRMWAFNIREMGVMDLPAFVSRVLKETGFEKLGLVCHSQGTTETLVALAKEQRPELGEKISVFCALAPAAYAGPLIKKAYFKFMRLITPGMFSLLFGKHAFIPFMMVMHRRLPGRLYGSIGYRVFSFLFDWSDQRWEKDLRDRMFQFSPVYISAESMRWWLGRECFAKHKCILSTREEHRLEDEEDLEHDENGGSGECEHPSHNHGDHARYAWYNERAPPMAFWIAGNDKLVDGRRLLRRFERGREPYVRVVHSKVIENYEHLDVLWAVDVLEQVGKELRQVLWSTAPPRAKEICRVPDECHDEKVTTAHEHSSERNMEAAVES